MKTTTPTVKPFIPEALLPFREKLEAIIDGSKDLTDKTSNAAFILKLRLDSAGTDLAKHAENMAVNPAYAFEWADNAFKAAAMIDFIGRIAGFSEGFLNCDGSPKDLEITLCDVMVQFTSELRDSVLQNHFHSNSTSPTHNAMMAARQEVACGLVTERAFRRR